MSHLSLHGVFWGRQPFILTIFILSQFVFTHKYIFNLKWNIQHYVKRKRTSNNLILKNINSKCKCNFELKEKQAEINLHKEVCILEQLLYNPEHRKRMKRKNRVKRYDSATVSGRWDITHVATSYWARKSSFTKSETLDPTWVYFLV